MAHENNERYPKVFKKQIVDFYNVGAFVAKFASEYSLIDYTVYK